MATLTPELIHSIRELHRLREEQDKIVTKINKFHAKLSEKTRDKAEKLPEKLWPKLREYYVDAKRLAESEERLLIQLTKDVEALGAAHASGTQPRKRASAPAETKRAKQKQENGAEAASQSGSNSGSAAASAAGVRSESHSGTKRDSAQKAAAERTVVIGEMVAARVSSDEAPKDDWILVKVLHCDGAASMYEVIDEEPGDEEEPGPRKYTLQESCIIPLPKESDPASSLQFPVGSQVLALYPGTTALYRAAVVGPPRKNPHDIYLLEFDDDEEDGVDGLPQRPVPFHHVVTLPAGHRQ